MTTTRREFVLGSMAAAGAGAIAATGAASLAGAAGATAAGPSAPAGAGKAGGSEALLRPHPDHPKPSTLDRLDETWHRGRVTRLKARLNEEGLAGILLSDRWNIIYFSGLWFTSTERPFTLFVPAAADTAPTWFHPSLDRDLVGSWWIKDAESYFDFQHGDGAFPNLGKVQMGATVDLTRWLLKGLKKRGHGGKPIGVDFPITADWTGAVDEILPGTTLRKAGAIGEKMRMVKTPEEIALTQRAMNYWSRIHAFARDYILEHGTDATDFEVQMAATRWGTDLIMNDIKRDGKPHTAVGIEVGIGVRTGLGTAYPHPNQFHHNRIKKGDALQVAGVVTIAGCGGEQYRAYQIEPWDAAREKMWQVHTDCCRIQAEESAAGVTCSLVAKKVHDYQVANGMAKYIYHRPAHGQGWEGHQPPYIALGDHTMLEENMMFSNEPGLYAPDLGFGYNHSDVVLVGVKRGLQLGSVPYSKEWCTLKL